MGIPVTVTILAKNEKKNSLGASRDTFWADKVLVPGSRVALIKPKK